MGSKYEPAKPLSCVSHLEETMTIVTQVRLAWLCWLLAAMLFFSGTSGTGGPIILLVAVGIALSLLAIARWFLR
jgi:hypothetical protein